MNVKISPPYFDERAGRYRTRPWAVTVRYGATFQLIRVERFESVSKAREWTARALLGEHDELLIEA